MICSISRARRTRGKGQMACLALFLVLSLKAVKAQDHPPSFRVMFYNVENFFDPFDDSLTRDQEFTPGGARNWTYSRFMDKAVKIARVIIACSNPEPPAIVGLAEVENRFVLEKLVYQTPLSRLNYGIVHQDSPDARGIDVAMLYRKEVVSIDTFYGLPVALGDTAGKTRDILMARCLVFERDTLVVSVNHWPSRYGGAAGSAAKRYRTACALKEHLEEMCFSSHCGNVIIMGDFNDEPMDPSLLQLTGEGRKQENRVSPELVNLSLSMQEAGGTVKYDGHWFTFDQIIVSYEMKEGRLGLSVKNEKAAAYAAAFLLEADNSHLGKKPFRTFLGPAYHRGFSDHLPVLLTIYIQEHF